MMQKGIKPSPPPLSQQISIKQLTQKKFLQIYTHGRCDSLLHFSLLYGIILTSLEDAF